MYPSVMQSESIIINEVCHKFKSICIERVKFDCKKQTIVYVGPTFRSDVKPRPAKIKYFFIHTLQNEDTRLQHALAFVDWLRPHHDKDYYVKPMEMWWCDE